LAKLDVFVAPKPWLGFSKAMSWVNRVFMLHGVPLLRDVPLLRRIPGIRGLTDIRTIIVDPNEIAQLKALCDSKAAVFILPNHPEFFTDWMMDKEIISRCCPNAASWATNGVVNGMGNVIQKFWLWNNLIAQIPGDSTSAKKYSIDWALKGNGVLLHPEGAVGWHSNYVAPLMSGAADMALEAKRLAPHGPAFLVPVVWKLEFIEDATSRLSKECSYVEKKLRISNASHGNPAERVYAIYNELLDRELLVLETNNTADMPALEKRRCLEHVIKTILSQYLGAEISSTNVSEIAKQVRRKARNEPMENNAIARQAQHLAQRLQLIARLGDFAGHTATTTHEEVAEHVKRLRNDWCKGTLRDTVNAYLPQPAARRIAHLRILEQIEVKSGVDPQATMAKVRTALQDALDLINEKLETKSSRKDWVNPFFSK
jgi:hypothetical protein